MSKVFRPMLAVACTDLTKVGYPVYLSEKLDGIRMSVHGGVCMSRSMKPIPSKAVQTKFGKPEYEGFDGEIVYGHKNAKDVFNKSTRCCMSVELPDDFEVDQIKFFVFDKIGDLPYEERYWNIVTGWPEVTGVYKLRNQLVNSAEEVAEIEKEFLEVGAEGVILRSLTGPYKQGRSTLKEGYLLKVKQFSDSECIVLGFEEKMHNANEATVGELGQTKRSSHQDNMVPMNTLGSLHVRDLVTGVDFHIGTGFNDVQRKNIWDNKEDWLGKVVKYSHFEAGVKDKPRFPVFVQFIGERATWDMS
jgi:DNA ligase-1